MPEPEERSPTRPESDAVAGDDEMPDVVELQAMVDQWSREFALERELADIGSESAVTWVPLAEAERQARLSRSTLRAWYRSGQIASRLMPGPHGLQRLVPLEAILDRAARSPRTGPRPATTTKSAAKSASEEEPVSPGLSTPDAMVRLAELAASAAAERAQAAEARAAAAEAALHAAIERAAAAEAEVRLLRAKKPKP